MDCEWADINYGGNVMYEDATWGCNWYTYGDNLVPWGWNDRISSLYNNTHMNAFFWENINESGHLLIVPGPSAITDLRTKTMTSGKNWNDQISSYATYCDGR